VNKIEEQIQAQTARIQQAQIKKLTFLEEIDRLDKEIKEGFAIVMGLTFAKENVEKNETQFEPDPKSP